MTNQPEWKCVANLGDVTPWDYGGAFVMVDQTGVYQPELWLFDNVDEDRPKEYRIILDQCTYENGVLSDNKYHPEYPAWFGHKPSLRALASYSGILLQNLIDNFCSEDPIDRAYVYRQASDYYGPENFDQYPVWHESKSELREKMEGWLKQIEQQ